MPRGGVGNVADESVLPVNHCMLDIGECRQSRLQSIRSFHIRSYKVSRLDYETYKSMGISVYVPQLAIRPCPRSGSASRPSTMFKELHLEQIA